MSEDNTEIVEQAELVEEESSGNIQNEENTQGLESVQPAEVETTLPSFGDVTEEPDEILRIKKENLELKEKLKSRQEVIEKPTLVGCNYDEDKYTELLSKWLANKHQPPPSNTDVFSEKLAEYNVQKKALKNHEFYELKVVNKLSNDQQAIIVAGVDDPAKFIYALGRDDSILEELSKIGNNAQFAKRVYKLEEKLARPKKPEPEKTIKGGASTDSNSTRLDKLRAEALRTGDVSKVVQFKRSNNVR